MITDNQAEAANDYIRDNAVDYAEAKAQRVYLEEFRKSKKALLFSQCPCNPGDKVTVAERENYAYSHPEYVEILHGLQAAVEKEEEIRWRMKAAELKINLFQTQQASNRLIDRTHR